MVVGLGLCGTGFLKLPEFAGWVILVIHEPTRRVLRMSLTFNGMMGMAGRRNCESGLELAKSN